MSKNSPIRTGFHDDVGWISKVWINFESIPRHPVKDRKRQSIVVGIEIYQSLVLLAKPIFGLQSTDLPDANLRDAAALYSTAAIVALQEELKPSPWFG